MTTELMRYEGHRFLLYKKWDYAPNGRTPEQTKALEAGKALFKAANFEHWASQPELVARVQKFLVESIPSYRASPYGDRPDDIIKALCWEVRNEAAVIVRAKPEYVTHGGFIPKREFDYAAYRRDQDERGRAYMARSKAYSDDLKAYNKSIDDRIRREANALKPYRHIETVTEAGERNLAAWEKRDALAALASAASMVASSLPSRDDNVFDLGEVSEIGSDSTPLGDAAPFDYVKSTTGSDVMSIGARGVSETHEAECFSKYETELDMCNAIAPHMGGGRALNLCKQNAFDRYQQCRGF